MESGHHMGSLYCTSLFCYSFMYNNGRRYSFAFDRQQVIGTINCKKSIFKTHRDTYCMPHHDTYDPTNQTSATMIVYDPSNQTTATTIVYDPTNQTSASNCGDYDNRTQHTKLTQPHSTSHTSCDYSDHDV